MNWNWRVVIIVPAAYHATAEAFARGINSTGPDYVGDAFNMPLSQSGSEPVTHYGLATPATDSMVAAMSEALPQMGGVQYWRRDVNDALVASNVTAVSGQEWSIEQSLAAAGLVRVSP